MKLCWALFFLILSHLIFAQDSNDTKKSKDISSKKMYESIGPTRWLFVGKGLENIAELPFEMVESLFNTLTLRNHDELVWRSRRKLKKELPKKTIQEKNKEKLIGDLKNEYVSQLPIVNCKKPHEQQEYAELDAIIKKVQEDDSDCFCSAWNTCEKEKCSCASLCPFDMTIMRKTAHQMIPSEENSLHFRNHAEGVFKYQELSGFCWGHSTVEQRMVQLSVFKPEEKCPYEEGSRDWVLFYKRIIDDLVHNTARIIPGFKNLYEFSGHPAFEEYIALQVSKTWAKQAAGIANMKHFIRLKNDKKSNLQFVKRTKEYIDFNVSPVIVKSEKIDFSYGFFSAFTDLGNAHAVVAYKYEVLENGSTKIYFRDNSETIESNAKGENYVVIGADGELIEGDYTYHLIDRHFKRDIVRQVASMQMLCFQEMCR